jgi:hypothetical protein
MKKIMLLIVASFFLMGIGSTIVFTPLAEAGWGDKLKKKMKEEEEKAKKEAEVVGKDVEKGAKATGKGLLKGAEVAGDVAVAMSCTPGTVCGATRSYSQYNQRP